MTDITSINNLLSASEVAVGLVLCGKQTVTSFQPDKFSGKYANIMMDLKAGKTQEELIVKYGTTLIQSAKYAAQSVNGLGTELDWAEVIDKAYRSKLVQDELKRVEKFLANGETEKATDLLSRSLATMRTSQRLNSVLASEISDEYTAYINSGSVAWDTHFGGLPNVGLVVLGAKTYTGKTTVAISLMEKFLGEYPDKKILFVTLEDMNEGWKFRAKAILGNKSKEFWERIRVMEFAGNATEILEEAARHNDIGMVVVDYLEYMVKENDISTYAEVYKTLATGAKELAVANIFRSMPIILLAQFGKTLYKGGVPTPDALPYVDQRFIYQLVMLYQPEGDFYSDNAENAYVLPSNRGKGFLISWKCKNARPHDPEFPGAIEVNWSGKYGYDLSSAGIWFSLASETKRVVQTKRK